MKKLLLILLVLLVLLNSAYAQNSLTKIEQKKSGEALKLHLVNLRNQLALAETEDEYQEIFDELADKVVATETDQSLKKIVRAKVSQLGDFSLQSLFVKKLDNVIEKDSTNLFFLGCFSLGGWKDTNDCSGFADKTPLLFFLILFPIWLDDSEVSSDI